MLKNCSSLEERELVTILPLWASLDTPLYLFYRIMILLFGIVCSNCSWGLFPIEPPLYPVGWIGKKGVWHGSGKIDNFYI